MAYSHIERHNERRIERFSSLLKECEHGPSIYNKHAGAGSVLAVCAGSAGLGRIQHPACRKQAVFGLASRGAGACDAYCMRLASRRQVRADALQNNLCGSPMQPDSAPLLGALFLDGKNTAGPERARSTATSMPAIHQI